jgi:putative component of toxin-antitoxin plasmid stabilization module
MIEVALFDREDSACPFSDWFENLDNSAALKVRTALARIEAGNVGDKKEG